MSKSPKSFKSSKSPKSPKRFKHAKSPSSVKSQNKYMFKSSQFQGSWVNGQYQATQNKVNISKQNGKMVGNQQITKIKNNKVVNKKQKKLSKAEMQHLLNQFPTATVQQNRLCMYE